MSDLLWFVLVVFCVVFCLFILCVFLRRDSKKGCVKKLTERDCSWEARKEAVAFLRSCRWKPQTEIERLYYFFAGEDWYNLMAMGPAGVEFLMDRVQNRKIPPGAIRALGKLRDEHVARCLSGMIDVSGWGSVDDNDYERARAARNALAEMGPQAVEPLIDRYSRFLNETVRKELIEALIKIGDPRSADFFLKVLQEEYPWEKEIDNAALGLEKIGWKPKDIKERVRFLLAKKEYTAIDFSDPSAAECVFKAFLDKNCHMRTRAIQAVQDIRWKPAGDDDCATSILVEILKDQEADRLARRNAARLLGKTKDERLVDVLIKASDDRDVNLQYAALRGLAEIRSEKAILHLINRVNFFMPDDEDDDFNRGDKLKYPVIGFLYYIGEPAVQFLNHFLSKAETSEHKKHLIGLALQEIQQKKESKNS